MAYNGLWGTQPWMGGNLRRRWKLSEERRDAQFPSWFEVKMNSVRKIQFTPSCPWPREGRSVKACLAHTALEDKSAVSCFAP